MIRFLEELGVLEPGQQFTEMAAAWDATAHGNNGRGLRQAAVTPDDALLRILRRTQGVGVTIAPAAREELTRWPAQALKSRIRRRRSTTRPNRLPTPRATG
jgi:hypothetical protein